MDVILQVLVGLLLVALEVPGVPRADIRPLEVPDEDPLKVRPVADAVVREEFKPCSNMFPHADEEVLNDEMVIIHSSGSAGEPEVFEPYTGVRLTDVPGDVGGRSEALWERCFLDTAIEGPWPRAIGAGAPVVRSAAMPWVHVPALLDGQARACIACSCRHSIGVIIVPAMASIVDDATSIMVWPEAFMHRRSVWSRHRVRSWRSCGLLFYTLRL